MKRETVSNKHNFVNYHIACKEIAVVVLYVAKEDTKTYLAEVLVKLLAYSRNLALLGDLFNRPAPAKEATKISGRGKRAPRPVTLPILNRSNGR